MANRDPELYKDKVEVSLDGRQIFYLFFGGSVIVGMVFVLGVLVGRRVEARGHVDRARTHTAQDPLAALDRLEGSGGLSFQGALTGKDAPAPVEKKVDAIAKERSSAPPPPASAAKTDGKTDAKAEPKTEAKTEPKTEAKIEKKVEPASGPVVKPEADKKTEPEKKAEPKLEKKVEADKKVELEKKAEPKLDKKAEDKKAEDKKAEDKKVDDKPAKKADKPADAEAKAEPKPEEKRGEEKKPRYTLQLSSFQDREEAEAYLASVKAQGFSARITQAEVDGKGTFYRVRMGTYGSMEAANEAKSELEKAGKSASVMKL